MQLTSLVAAALLAHSATAANLRFACSQLVVDRVDPLVDPGMTYTPHLHQIVGGDGFNVTMDDTHDLPAASKCTSCSFAQDFSNYWTAVMFFKAKNGTYKRVPQVANGGPEGMLEQKGGITVYYMYPGGKNSGTASFKKGFRMLAGDAANTDVSKVTKSRICNRCWNKPTITNKGSDFVGSAPCTGSDGVDIPNDTSCSYIRQTIIFPDCWDGKNLDSPDHKSHMAYSNGQYGSKGTCPSTHPTRTSQIMYEVMWDLRQFQAGRTANDGSSFTFSYGAGGAGAHGDYVFGWKDDSLQKALDGGCTEDTACAGLTKQATAAYEGCTKQQQAPEDVDSWLKALPVGSKAIKA